MSTNLQPQITILVPCYNSARFIHKTLQSIMKQEYPNFDVVLYDDCSTDNTVEVLHSWREEYPQKIRVVEGTTNLGLCEVRKLLISSSYIAGDFFLFVDSDDLLHKNALANLARYLHPDTDVVVGKHRIFRFFVQWHLQQQDKLAGFIYLPDLRANFRTTDQYEFLVNNRNPFWNKVFRKDFFKNIVDLMPHMEHVEDTFTSYAILKAQKFAICPKTTYYYRNRKNSLIGFTKRTNWEKIKEYLRDFMKSFDIVKQLIHKDQEIMERPGILKKIQEWEYSYLTYTVLANIYYWNLTILHQKPDGFIQPMLEDEIIPWLKEHDYKFPKNCDFLTSIIKRSRLLKNVVKEFKFESKN